jgi:hypothetical protein
MAGARGKPGGAPENLTNAGKGRPKGSVNRSTADARAAIADFVDGNAHRLAEWLDKVAVDNPEKAFQLFQSVIEYHVPKLARTDTTVSGPNGGPVNHSISISFVEPE